MKNNKPPIKDIEAWFAKEGDDGSFPSTVSPANYKSQYELLKTELTRISQEAEKGALLSSFNSSSKYVYLNDHGPEHIREVIKNATMLLEIGKIRLTLYETYLLLFSIYLHDCGNIHGREKHEKKIVKIMAYLGTKAGRDTIEKRYVLSIAGAHGGTVDGTNHDKNKIARITEASKPRLRVLAAVLRLADELSDKRGRGSAYMMEAGEVPRECQIFHEYSQALYEIECDEHTIKVKYELKWNMVESQFGKGDSTCFLVDEIKARTIKMFRESLYCCRYLKPGVDINKVQVKMDFYMDFDPGSLDIQPLKTLEYSLEESGYPLENEDFEKLFPVLKDIDGQKIKNELTEIRSHG